MIDEKKLLKDGWIKSRLWFEVMATSKEITEKTLKDHVEKIKTVEGVKIGKVKFEKVEEVKEIPQNFKLRNVNKLFSQAVNVEIFTDSVEKLLLVVMLFGPSAIEVLEPKKFELGLVTIQTIMNSVADLIHRFAATSLGGIIVEAKK